MSAPTWELLPDGSWRSAQQHAGAPAFLISPPIRVGGVVVTRRDLGRSDWYPTADDAMAAVAADLARRAAIVAAATPRTTDATGETR